MLVTLFIDRVSDLVQILVIDLHAPNALYIFFPKF